MADEGQNPGGTGSDELVAESPGAARAATDGEGAVSEVILNLGPENRPTAVAEVLRADAGDVEAGTVAMEGAGAEHVTAERVVMTNSGAKTIDARSAQIDRSGVLAVRADKAVFYQSTAVAVAAEEVRISRGNVFALKADKVTLEGDARIAIYAGPPSDAVRPMLDARGAAALGAGLGGVLLLLGGLLRRLFRTR